MTPQRWIIDGSLEVVTPLAIRTGASDEFIQGQLPTLEPNFLPDLAGGESVPVSGIELDHEMRPFVPATAIKGLVRSIVALGLVDARYDGILLNLLGDLPRAKRSVVDPLAQVALGGLAEFRNAHLPPTTAYDARPALRGRTAIHEGSRTAEDGQLRHDRIVAPGTQFDMSVLACGATEAEVAVLLALLNQIDGQGADSALGAGTTQGDGRVRWQFVRLRRFGQDEARAWMALDADRTWQSCAAEVTVPPDSLVLMPATRVNLPLALQIEGPFLVAANEAATNAENTVVSRKRPYRVHAQDETTARLAGASMDGALRAQARRIWRTMSGDAAAWAGDDRDQPAAFESLFGSARQASLLEVETFLATDLRLVEQEFVAIDRLSGGGQDGKKFSIKAFEAPRLTGALSVVLRRSVRTELTGKTAMTQDIAVTPAAIGLLALTLKDLAAGDIPLGHGTRKGYGGVARLEFGSGGWRDLLRQMGEAAIAAGIVTGANGEAGIKAAVRALEAETRAWAAQCQQAGGQK